MSSLARTMAFELSEYEWANSILKREHHATRKSRRRGHSGRRVYQRLQILRTPASEAISSSLIVSCDHQSRIKSHEWSASLSQMRFQSGEWFGQREERKGDGRYIGPAWCLQIHCALKGSERIVALHDKGALPLPSFLWFLIRTLVE